ncbi:M10 family metallopeptidase C-terminal domain-containing protein [Palleronia sp. KMU-117]|uniref:calcium-binding protein n=1 Tax=Palleronia sp. KMU-117 TaxID=3434108 RepID=UPI003D75475C
MSVLEFGGLFGTVEDPLLRGLTALHRVEIGGVTYLVAAGRNGLSVLRIGTDGTAVPAGQLVFETAFLPGLTPTLSPSPSAEGILALGGQMPGGVSFVEIAPDGTPTVRAAPSDWPVSASLVSSIGSGTTASILSYDAFTRVLRLHTLDALSDMSVFAATAPGVLTGVRALAGLAVGSADFALVADSRGTIAALRVSVDAGFVITDRIGPADGLTISAVTQLAPVRLGAEAFVLVGAAGSSSLSVLRLDPTGALTLTDHVIDALNNRFQALSALSVIAAGDRVYVFAGGADDGISTFLLLPGGTLQHLGVFADTTATSLQNVTALSAFVRESELVVLASGEGESGITELLLDLSDDGPMRLAGPSGGSLGGTALDDILVGGFAADTLSGGAGDDLLFDGAGADLLSGGTGADVFVFALDGATDRIADFNAAQDRIDLSRIPMLYDPGEFSIISTATGAEFRIRGELLIAQSSTGTPILVEDARAALVVSVNRPQILPATPLPTPGPDTLIGGDADDILSGGPGDDLIEGRGGNDILLGDQPMSPEILARYRVLWESHWPDDFGPNGPDLQVF